MLSGWLDVVGVGRWVDGTGLRPGEATGRVEVTTPGSPREGDEQGRRSRKWRLIFCAPPPPLMVVKLDVAGAHQSSLAKKAAVVRIP